MLQSGFILRAVGTGRPRDRDGRSRTHGRGVDSYNAQHLDQKSQVFGTSVLDSEFSNDRWLHRHHVHHEPRRAVHIREEICRGLEQSTSVLRYCDIFLRGYYSSECEYFFQFVDKSKIQCYNVSSNYMYALDNVQVLPLKNEMRKPSNFNKSLGVLNVGMVIVGSMFVAMGFLSYLKYGDDVAGSVTLNLAQKEMWVSKLITLRENTVYNLSHRVSLTAEGLSFNVFFSVFQGWTGLSSTIN